MVICSGHCCGQGGEEDRPIFGFKAHGSLLAGGITQDLSIASRFWSHIVADGREDAKEIAVSPGQNLSPVGRPGEPFDRVNPPAEKAHNRVKFPFGVGFEEPGPMGISNIFRSSGLRSLRSIRHKGKRFSEILEAHERFVRGDETGARADLSGADLSNADLRRANLAYADLRGVNLNSASLREAKLASSQLSQARLRKADLRKADLTEANLRGADLAEAALGGAELFRADLRGAILRGADLGAANLRDAQVQGADFRGASLKTTILRETNLDGVDLSGLDLSTALLPPNHKLAGRLRGDKD